MTGAIQQRRIRSRGRSVHTRTKWIGAWAAAQQEPASSDLFGRISVDGFENQTIRMVIRPLGSGTAARVRLSNTFGMQDLTFGAVAIALSRSGAETIPGTHHTVTFGGNTSVTIPVGTQALSDPVALTVAAGQNLAVSLFVDGKSGPTTWHFLSNQTSYRSEPGDFTEESGGESFHTTHDSWFWLSAVDVLTEKKRTRVVVTLGNSITDGYRSTLNGNHRYPDFLADRMARAFPDQAIAVLNAGIAGNRILSDDVGPSGLARLNRDVIAQTGVTDLILLQGINDIAEVTPARDPEQIINGMKQIIVQVQEQGICAYGGTLTPFRGSDIFSDGGEATRQIVNQWIRSSGAFDAVLDFDRILADPLDPERLLPAYDSGDHLHPNDIGYQAMAEAVDLSLFARR